MAATPKYGTFNFRGMQTGKSYSLDIYLSDVANALINVDAGAGAGASSPTYFIAPENLELIDYAQVTGTADTTKLRLTVDGKPTSQLLRYAIHLTTLNNRPKLSIRFAKGSQISALQLA